MRALAGLLLTAGGCDPRGAIDVSWTLGGVAPDGDPLVCASHGIDAVWIAATDPGTEDVSAEGVLPCKDGAGSVGDIAPGEVDVHVFGLAPSYRRLTTAEPARLVAIEDDETTPVRVDLPLPSACADGVDADADGRADAADSDCTVLAFRLSWGEAEGGCALVVTQRLALLDEDGAVIDPPAVADDGAPLDGETTAPCRGPEEVVRVTVPEPGRYTLTVSGGGDADDPCPAFGATFTLETDEEAREAALIVPPLDGC